MTRPLPILLTALLLALAAGRLGATDTTRQTLARVETGLAGAAPVRVVPLLDSVAVAVGASMTAVRAHLRRDLARLDPADTTLLALRPPAMSPPQARRFLRELIAAATRVLADDRDYLLGTSLRWAARQARVPATEAASYTRQLLAHARIDSAAGHDAEPVAVVVSGWTEPYELSLAPLYVFFGTDDTDVVREATRDIQRFLVPLVVRQLPAWAGVGFAVRERDLTALVDPDYEMHLTVRSLRFTGTNADLLPCLDVGIEVTAAGTGRPLWDADIEHCTETHGSARVDELRPFFEESAGVIGARFQAWLETPK